MYPSSGVYGQNVPLTGNHAGHIMDISTHGQHMTDTFGCGGRGHIQRPFGIPNAIGNTMMGMNPFPSGGYPGFYGGGGAGGHGYHFTGNYGSGAEPFTGSHTNVGPFGSGIGSFASDVPFGSYGPVYGSSSPFGGPSYGGSNPFGKAYHDTGLKNTFGSNILGLNNDPAFAAEKQNYSDIRTGFPGRPSQSGLSEERNGEMKPGSTDTPNSTASELMFSSKL
ncbi:hypothetical protein TTRE_0000712301 [Trichuris trichiura]|uniref:Uncharacterized protein n=1 Tax=Trichuris trichiura TaxID=36087 RepID=A0A077ZGM9_TRITR|nr:hypothetical protein TTRE_0000712301 [Trichuris trichiura]